MIKIEDTNIGDVVLIQQKFQNPNIQRMFGKIYEVKISQFSMNKHLFQIEGHNEWLKVEDYNFIDKVI